MNLLRVAILVAFVGGTLWALAPWLLGSPPKPPPSIVCNPFDPASRACVAAKAAYAQQKATWDQMRSRTVQNEIVAVTIENESRVSTLAGIVAATTTTIFGLSDETIRSIVQAIVTICVALIAGGISLRVSSNAAKASREIENAKRGHVDAGLTRKLNLLMKRASNRIELAIDTLAMDVDVWASSADELNRFVMTPELASAVTDNGTMLAAYDVLQTLENALHLSRRYYSTVSAEYEERVAELGGDYEVAGSMWSNHGFRVMIGYLVPPAKALAKYWRATHDEVAAGEAENAVAEAERRIAQFAPPPRPKPVLPLVVEPLGQDTDTTLGDDGGEN